MVQHYFSAMRYQVDSGSSQAARCDSRGQQSAVRTYLLFLVVSNCLCTIELPMHHRQNGHPCAACMWDKIDYMHQFTTLDRNAWIFDFLAINFRSPYISVVMTLPAADRAVLFFCTAVSGRRQHQYSSAVRFSQSSASQQLFYP